MELIKCKKCGHEISKKEKTCPNCGEPIPLKISFLRILIGVLIFGTIYFSIGIYNSLPRRQTKKSKTSNDQNISKPAPKLPGSQWFYYQSFDAMGKGKTYEAQVSSLNTVNFDFPYSGVQHATLTLRTHPRYGKDIIFSIEKGQILCRSYEDCTILVRFDDGESIKYSARGPEDQSTETIFIHDYYGFVKRMLKAKRVRIAANFYQEGNRVFEFDVTGFEQVKYKPKPKSRTTNK